MAEVRLRLGSGAGRTLTFSQQLRAVYVLMRGGNECQRLPLCCYSVYLGGTCLESVLNDLFKAV